MHVVFFVVALFYNRETIFDFLSLHPWVGDIAVCALAIYLAFRAASDEPKYKNALRCGLGIVFVGIGLTAYQFAKAPLEKRRIIINTPKGLLELQKFKERLELNKQRSH